MNDRPSKVRANCPVAWRPKMVAITGNGLLQEHDPINKKRGVLDRREPCNKSLPHPAALHRSAPSRGTVALRGSPDEGSGERLRVTVRICFEVVARRYFAFPTTT